MSFILLTLIVVFVGFPIMFNMPEDIVVTALNFMRWWCSLDTALAPIAVVIGLICLCLIAKGRKNIKKDFAYELREHAELYLAMYFVLWFVFGATVFLHPSIMFALYTISSFIIGFWVFLETEP